MDMIWYDITGDILESWCISPSDKTWFSLARNSNHSYCFHWASTGLPLGFHCTSFRCIRKCNAKSLVLSAVSTQGRNMWCIASHWRWRSIWIWRPSRNQGSSANRPTVRTHCWVFQMPISKYNISCIQIVYPSIANLLPKVLDNLSSEPSPSFTKSILGASGHTAHGTTASFGVPLRHWGNSGRSNGRSKCRSTTYHHIAPHITAYQHTNYSLWIFVDLYGLHDHRVTQGRRLGVSPSISRIARWKKLRC